MRSLLEMLAEAAVEALDHAVGLRVKRADQAVGNLVLVQMRSRHARRTAGRAASLFVDGKAVGELGTLSVSTGVDGERKAVEKAAEKAGCGDGAAIGQDLEIDEAGGAVDRDLGLAAAAVERRQVFDIEMDKAGRGIGMERGGRGLLPGQTGRDAVPLQAAVDLHRYARCGAGTAGRRRRKVSRHRM